MEDINRQSALKHALAKKIKDFDTIVSEMQVFGIGNAQNEMIHLVLYLLIHIPPELEWFSHDYVEALMLLDGSTISLEFYFNQLTYFQVKTGLYNITYHFDLKVALVSNETSLSVDVFRFSFSHTDNRNGCIGKELALTKLRVCPFIEFNMNEILLHFENDFLIIDEGSGNSKGKTAFSRWLYEVDDKKIRLCLNDYVSIYNNMARQQEYTLGTSAQIFPSRNGLPLFLAAACHSFCLFI